MSLGDDLVRSLHARVAALRDGDPLIVHHPKRLRTLSENLRQAHEVLAAVETDVTRAISTATAVPRAPSLFDSIVGWNSETPVEECCWLVATPPDIVRAYVLPRLSWHDMRLLACTCRHFARLFFARVARVNTTFDSLCRSTSTAWRQLDWAPLSACVEICVRPGLGPHGYYEFEFVHCAAVTARLFERARAGECWVHVHADGLHVAEEAVRRVPLPSVPRVSPRLLVVSSVRALDFLSAILYVDVGRVREVSFMTRGSSSNAVQLTRWMIESQLLPRAPHLHTVRLSVAMYFAAEWVLPQVTRLVIHDTPSWQGDVRVALANMLEIRFVSVSAMCEFLAGTSTRVVAQTHPRLVLDQIGLSAGVVPPRGARYAVQYTEKCSEAFRAATAGFIDWTPYVASPP